MAEATGRISWISPAIDERTRSVQVRVPIDNSQGRLRDKTFGTGTIILREEPQAIVVPREAIQATSDARFVFVRDKNYLTKDALKVFHVRQVRTGAQLPCSSQPKRIGEQGFPALAPPADDRFQVISQHSPENLIADENYLGIRRTRDCVFIHVTLRGGRTLDQKKAFYKAVADGLNGKLGLRREDVFICLVENAKEDWSFGNGLATYATA